jgi:hypothetical protein
MVLDQYLIDIQSELDEYFDQMTNDLQLILDNFQIAYDELKNDKGLMKAHKKEMAIIKNALKELDSFNNEGGEMEAEDEDDQEDEQAGSL